jgi:spermidine synthase
MAPLLKPPAGEHPPVKVEKELMLAVSALGVTAVVGQIVLLRESLSVFYGNELVIGIVLTNWMVLTGAGSFMGKVSDRLKNRMNLMVASLLLIAVLPAATLFLLDYLRNIVFTRGSMIGIIEILYSSFILLAPFCLVSGFSFTLFSHAISERYRSNLITNVYSLEAAGGVIGGLVFNLFMVYFLRTFQSLLLLMAFDLAVAFILALRLGNRAAQYTVAVVSLLLLSVPVAFDIDDITRGFLFKDQRIIYSRDTPYGSLTITEQAEQKNFFENNVLLFSTEDVEMSEESVHYAMLQHPDPKSVLMISGGISGATREVLKYDVNRIDYVELNPWLIDIGKEHTSALSDRRVRAINADARLFLRDTEERYDAVLINVPDPSTARVNRYYTVEFFQDLKRRLNKDAVVSVGLLTTADYWGTEALRISSIIYNTMKTSFRNVLIIPGGKNYLIASDNDVGINIAGMVEERGLDNLYVNKYYLDDRTLRERSGNIMDNLDRDAMLNKDFSPVAYYRQLRYWMSYFRFNHWTLAFLGLAILVLSALRMNTVSFGLFTGGFASASIEVVLLIAFQVIYGYVYHVTGLIITIFMGGLAAGALYRHKILARADITNYTAVQFGIGVYCVILPFLLLLLKSAATHYFLIHSAFFVLTFFMAAMVGMEFSIASRLRGGTFSSVASELYGVDLLGSAVGALWVTTYLIPLLGITNVCFIVASLSFLSGINSFINRKRYPEAAA